MVTNLVEMEIPTEILLKNLMIILDTSAETLDRIAMYLNYKGIDHLTIDNQVIKMKKLGKDKKISLSNKNIANADNALKHDIISILSFGYSSVEIGRFSSIKFCKLSKFANNPDLLDQHLRYLPLNSSSQIKQLRAVNFGQQLEKLVLKKIASVQEKLGFELSLDRRYFGQQFDLVLEKSDKFVVIEIAFQETTNSTLERKGKQAKNGLYESINAKGNKLIYIVDGAGYFKRIRALENLIEYSHFITNVSDEGLEDLIIFLEDYFEN
ncbi:MAG: DpnII family type II restriction endonuclease [Staphylococcus equorum]